MAKETQKVKIERLENEIQKLIDEKKLLMEQMDKLYKELSHKNNASDNDFSNSPYFQQLNNELNTLKEKSRIYENRCNNAENRGKAKDKQIKELEIQIQQLNNENIHSVHKKNERGAGRKTKFTNKQIEQIIQDRKLLTIKQLAEKYNCSVGLIHKLINEKEEEKGL